MDARGPARRCDTQVETLGELNIIVIFISLRCRSLAWPGLRRSNLCS